MPSLGIKPVSALKRCVNYASMEYSAVSIFTGNAELALKKNIFFPLQKWLAGVHILTLLHFDLIWKIYHFNGVSRRKIFQLTWVPGWLLNRRQEPHLNQKAGNSLLYYQIDKGWHYQIRTISYKIPSYVVSHDFNSSLIHQII